MLIDVIVPSFDESGEDVIISSWYKKVGDKIKLGEVIAEAETSTVACGITSGYDCILAKIEAKEGDCVPQGTKIAVIETESENSAVSMESNLDQVKEETEEELKNISVEAEPEPEQRYAILSVVDDEVKREENTLVSSTLDNLEKEEERIHKEEEKVVEKKFRLY